MSDDTNKAGQADRIRINVNQYHERRDWAHRLGISQALLREAVEAVGPMVKDVKEWLIKRINNA